MDLIISHFTLEAVLQYIILIGGGITIYLITRVSTRKRMYGYILGALIEPIWLWDAYLDHNWGIFLLCLVYTASYWDGFKKHRQELS